MDQLICRSLHSLNQTQPLSIILYLPSSVGDARCMHIDGYGCDVVSSLQLLASWLQSTSGAKTPEEKAEGLKQTLVAVENLEAAFKEISEGRSKPFFGGDSVGYLDVTLGALVAWVHAAEKLDGTRLFDGARTPLLNAWVERFGALEAAKAVLPDVDRLVEFAKQMWAHAAAAAASNK